MRVFVALWRRLALSMGRNRIALLLTYAMPLFLFMFFSVIFGGQGGGGGGGITVLMVGAPAEIEPMADALKEMGGVRGSLGYTTKESEEIVPWTEERARARVAAGDASLALIIPEGWLTSLLDVGGERPEATLIASRPDSVAAQMVAGLLVPAAVQAAFSGGFGAIFDPLIENLDEALALGEVTPSQHEAWTSSMREGMALWEEEEAAGDGGGAGEDIGNFMADFIPLKTEVAKVEGGAEFSVSAYYAGATAALFLLFTVVHLGGRLHEETENGYLRRILLGGAPTHTVLGAHIVHATGLSLGALVLMFVVAHSVFGADLATQALPLLVVAIATGFAFGAFGILFASFMPDRETLERGSTAVILPMSAVGGSMVPMEMLPSWVQTIGRLLPNGQAVVAFEKVGARHMALGDVTPQLIYLAVFTAVAFVWASVRWRQRWLA